MVVRRLIVLAALLAAFPARAAVECLPDERRLAALAVALDLPPAEEAFAREPSPEEETLAAFLRRRQGEVVLLDLRVRLSEPPPEPACRGNLTALEPGELWLRLTGPRLVILDRDPAVRLADCRPTGDGFAYSGFVYVAPPPEVASLRSWTLREVAVDALTASLTRRCLTAAGR